MYTGYGVGLCEVFLNKFLNQKARKASGKGSGNQDGLSVKNALYQLTTSLLCYPLSTIRRRLMVDAARDQRRYNGVFDCCKKIREEEGLRGFFNGLAMAALAGTLGYVASVILKKFLNPKPLEAKKVKPVEDSVNGNGFVDL